MNRYDALLGAADDEGARARLALRFGSDANADQAAREQALAKRFGLPPDAVRLDPKAFQVRARLEDSEPALRAAPKLRGWLAENPARAEVAHPDIAQLSAVEQAVQSFMRGSATLAMGATVGVGKSIFDVAGFLYDMVGADEQSATMRAAAKRAEEAMDAYGLQPGDSPTLKGIKSGLLSAGTNVAMLPLGIELAASKGIAAASQGVAGLMGLFTGSGAYNEARDQGKGKVASLAYGVPQGAFEYAFEVAPAARLFGDLAAGTGFWKTLWHQAKVEGWSEQLTTLAQDFNTWMNLHPDKTVAEFIAERPGAAYETLIATIVGVGVQTGGAKALHRVAGRGQRRDDEAAQAERRAQFLTDMAKTAEAIPTRERSPEDFQTFAQSLLDDDVPALHFDARVLLQAGVTSQELAKVSAAAAAALEDAAATGGSVSIATGEFLTNAPGSLALPTLVEHARIAPDAMSAAEAKTWMAERGDALQTEMADALAEKQGDQAFKDSQEAVRQTVLGELQAAGRAQAPVNEAYATLVAARTAVRAAQLGMTPEALFEKQRLRVRGDAGEGGAVLEQGGPDPTGEVDKASGLPLNRDGTVTVYHHTSAANAEQIRRTGRLQSAGEPDLYFTTTAETNTGYGDTALAVRVKPERLLLDDQFPDGRQDFRVESPRRVRRVRFRPDGQGELQQSAPPVATLRGDELGEISADTVVEKARQWFSKHLQGHPVVREGLGEVRITGKGWKKLKRGLPTDLDKARLIPAIPDIIERGQYLGRFETDKQRSDDIVAFHHFEAPVLLGGVVHQAGVSVAEDSRGHLFYNLNRDPQSRLENRKAPGLPRLEARGPAPISDSASADRASSVPAPADGINIDDKPTDDILKRGQSNTIATEPGAPYEQDLFGDSVLPPAGSAGSRAAGSPAAAGDVDATGGIPSAPAGEYATIARLVATRQQRLGAASVKTLEDSANALAYLGKSAVERLDAIVTDAAGKPLAVIGGFKGSLSQTAVYPSTLLGEAVQIDGAARIWLVHNHPSGSPELSRADEALARSIERTFDGTGISVDGIVAVGSGGKWGGGVSSDMFAPTKSGDVAPVSGLTVPAQERELAEAGKLGPAINSPTAAKAAVKAAVASNGGRPVILLMDAQLQPVASIPWSAQESIPLKGNGRLLALYRAVSQSNAGAVIVGLGDPGAAGGPDAVMSANQARNIGAAMRQADVRMLDIIDHNGKSEAEAGDILASQTLQQQARATFAPATNTITLLNGADLSSFLHEAGHYFFENDIALAAEIVRQQRGGASITTGEQALLDDVQALMRHHGFVDRIEEQLTEWYSLSFEQQREAHERTAESFEAYLFSGKAPSLELQRPFQQFRAWLLSVYKSLKDFVTKHPEAGKLDDEVRGVFDRMLATTEAIQEAEAARAMGPLFRASDGKMMDAEQWAAYNDLGLAATQDGIERLQARGLKDMKWLTNARGKALRELQAQAKAARDQVRIEMRADVMSRPIYRAWQFLTAKAPKDVDPGGDAPSATPKDKPGRALDASRDSILVAIAKLGGIARESALRDLSVTAEDFATPSGVFGAPIFRKTGGKSADDMRQTLQEWGYLREFDEFGRTELRELKDLVSAELRGQPQYSAHYDYGRDSAPVEPLPESVLYGRLDTDALRQRYGAGEDAVWRKLSARRMTAANGVHPDVVAETFGLESGDAMVQDLASATPPAEVIEALTDQRMLERHADLATPQALEDGVNAAVHTRLRERVLATELVALQRAVSVREGKPGQRGTVDVLAAAARDYAEQMVSAMKAGDLSPARFEAAAARAGRDAAKAFKAGDIAATAAAKRNQLIQVAAARAVRDERDQVQRTLRYFKRFDKPSKGLDSGFHDQIEALLEKFDLSSSERKSARTTSLRNWVLQRVQDGEAPPIAETMLSPGERQQYLAEVQERNADGDLVNDDERALDLLAGAIDRSARRPWRGVTVEELRGLLDTVKALEHQGRLKKRLLSNREQASYEAARDEMTAAVRKHGGSADKNTPTRTDLLGRALAGLKHFGAQHIKAATWARIMDGADGGPVWRYLIRPANTAASMETTMRAEATAALDEILRPILKRVSALDKIGQGRYFATLGRSLNWQERFAIALNTGNESNLQRLMDGSGWTMPKLMPVLQSLGADEWRAVQAVWDHFEAYRPQIAEKERRVNGKEPDWILPRSLQVNTSDGKTLTLRGGYYPVKFDPRVHLKASQHAAAEEASTLLKGAYSAATTRRSFTKARVAEVKGRPLLLDLSVLYGGINDVIHDLSWHEWVLDANKLLRSSQLDEAIRDHYGPEVKQELERWRDDIVAGATRLNHGIERAAGWARKSVTASALTFNVLSAAMQPLGLANSVARVGASWVGKGVARYAAAPIASTREAQAKSEWLRNRTRTRFRELNELRNQVQGQTAAKEMMGRYGYWMMVRMQMAVDVPTWWAGYEKATAEGFDEDTSVALADQSVKDSQGGGEEVDQSGIERGPALVKLFTAFYGFMGTTANVTYLTGKTESSKARAAAKIALVLMVPAVLGALLKDALIPGDDGDDDGLAKKLITEQISFLFGLVAFGREFTQVGKVLLGEGKGQGYSGPAGLRLIPDAVKLGQQAYQGEFDDAFRKAFVNVLGDLTGLPSVQINRTITGAQAIDDDLTEGPVEAVGALTFGFQKPR